MIDDSENKDFARLRFWKPEGKLFYARFIKINKKVNCELQTFLYVKSLFIQLLSVLEMFFQKGKNIK